MPTYEYRCAEGHDFERFQRISDPPLKKCPSCGAVARRQISGGQGLIFKGSGFYITDYGKDGKGPRKEPVAGGGEATPKRDAGSSGGSTDAKPATKAEPAAPKATPKADSA